MCILNQKPEQEPVPFFTPCATDATGFFFIAAEGRRGSDLGEPFRSADPQTTGAHEDWALVLGSIRQNGTTAFRDTPCPQHLGPGGGVLHSSALISDHKSSWAEPESEDWQRRSMKNTRSHSNLLLLSHNLWFSFSLNHLTFCTVLMYSHAVNHFVYKIKNVNYSFSEHKLIFKFCLVHSSIKIN